MQTSKTIYNVVVSFIITDNDKKQYYKGKNRVIQIFLHERDNYSRITSKKLAIHLRGHS